MILLAAAVCIFFLAVNHMILSHDKFPIGYMAVIEHL